MKIYLGVICFPDVDFDVFPHQSMNFPAKYAICHIIKIHSVETRSVWKQYVGDISKGGEIAQGTGGTYLRDCP